MPGEFDLEEPITSHNGVEVEPHSEPRCHTCSDDLRNDIDEMIFSLKSPSQIIAELGDTTLHVHNIRSHIKAGHYLENIRAKYNTMVQRANDAGMNLQEYEAYTSKEIFALEMVIDKFRTRLTDPEFEPDFKEGLAAIKLMHELTSPDSVGGFGPQDMFVALSTFMSHTRAVLQRYAPTVAGEAMTTLGNLLDRDPILNKITSNLTGVPSELEVVSEVDVVDAEIVSFERTFDEDPDFG